MNSLEEIEIRLGLTLPEPYRSYLEKNNESFIASNGLTLIFGRDTIIERNTTFESKRYCPSYLVVGDDSGGSAFVLSLSDGMIHSVSIGAMTPDCFEDVAPSFEAWANAGFPCVET